MSATASQDAGMDEDNASFGYWVQRRRKALDLTQADLARRVGCSTGLIRMIEADTPLPRPPAHHPHNLPIQLTSFVGREKEIAEIKRLLSPLSRAEDAGEG